MKNQEFNLELCVEVNLDDIILRLPDIAEIKIADNDLDHLFYYPESLHEICNEEQIDFWNNIIPDLIRIRERKRDLYYHMGYDY